MDRMDITNEDVCKFFGFSIGLNLELPGSMVMMLEGLVEKGYEWITISEVDIEEYSCSIFEYEEGISIYHRENWKSREFGATIPLAVLNAVKGLIKNV